MSSPMLKCCFQKSHPISTNALEANDEHIYKCLYSLIILECRSPSYQGEANLLSHVAD